MSSRHGRAMLDTSIIIDMTEADEPILPHESCIATITLAELTTGTISATSSTERAIRVARLSYVESVFEVVPFDAPAARAYGRIYAAVVAMGRKPRGGRVADFLVASTALSRGLPLYTRNPNDFAGLHDLLEIVAV